MQHGNVDILLGGLGKVDKFPRPPCTLSTIFSTTCVLEASSICPIRSSMSWVGSQCRVRPPSSRLKCTWHDDATRSPGCHRENAHNKEIERVRLHGGARPVDLPGSVTHAIAGFRLVYASVSGASRPGCPSSIGSSSERDVTTKARVLFCVFVCF